MSRPTTLRMVLAAQPVAGSVRDRAPSYPDLDLEFQDVTPVHRAFAPMVREAAYDVCELAVVTALQAVSAGRPVVVLPAVVAARRQRGCLVTRTDLAVTDPTELVGKRIAVRSYTQTTGMWVRRHLAEDFGISAEDVTWVTKDEAHVAQYQDPAFVRRELTGSVLEALRSGEVDAAILGNDLPEGEFLAATPDSAARDSAWCANHGYIPLNHLVVVSRSILERDPQAVRDVYELIAATEDSPANDSLPTTMFGAAALAGPLEEIIRTCVEQRLLEPGLTAAEVLAPAARVIGPT